MDVQETSFSVHLLDEKQHSGVNVPEILRKLNKKLLPACVLVLFFANIDRGNLAFVANPLCSDLKLTHTEYGAGAGVFFFGFVVSRIPSNAAMRFFGAPFWLATIMFVWGTFAAALAFIHTVHQFYVLRFFLGVAEGGAFPGVWFYLTGFFPDAYLTFPYAIISLALPLASVVSGPVAAVFLQMDGWSGMRSWRSLFFCEGLVPACFAPVFFFTMPKNISSSTFLSTQAKNWLKNQMHEDPFAKENGFIPEMKQIFRSRPFWILSLGGMLRAAFASVLYFWMALMIESSHSESPASKTNTCAASHSTSTQAMVFTAIVFGIAAIVTLIVGFLTDRIRNRSPWAAWIATAGGLAFMLWPWTQNSGRWMGLTLLTVAVCAVNATHPFEVGLLVSGFDAHSKAMALSLFATTTAMGGLLGPIINGVCIDAFEGYSIACVVTGLFGVVGGLTYFMVDDPLALQNNKSKTLNA